MKEVRNMAVIKTIPCGSGEIRIHDDYCKDKTPEEIQKIIDEASMKILNFYKRKAAG
jgi:hypothetical protein